MLRSKVIINEDGSALETVYSKDGSVEFAILYHDANDGIGYGPDRARTEKCFYSDGKLARVAIYKQGNNRNLPYSEWKTNLVFMEIYV